MISKRPVTFVAGEICVATGKLDCNNIQGRVPVPAFGSKTDVQAPNDKVVNVARVSQVCQLSVEKPIKPFRI
ncbi:hypothetical protein MCEMSE15_00768 [Fimbriimonadaceae bacterium]